MLQHHLGEVGRRHDLVQATARALVGVDEVDQFLLVRRDDAVRRQALDRERPGDADLALVLVGPVVEQLDIGRLGDRGVDLLLPGDAPLPPSRVRSLAAAGHVGDGLTRDFPVLEFLAERGVQLRAQRFKLRLPLLIDDVDLGVVGDRLQRHVRRALVDEALADVLMRRRVGQDFARDLLLLAPAFRDCRREDNRDSARS